MATVPDFIGGAIVGVVIGSLWTGLRRGASERRNARDPSGTPLPVTSEKSLSSTAEKPLGEDETVNGAPGLSAQALIERAAIGIFRASRDGSFIEVNPALVRMLGYRDSDALRAVDVQRDILWDEDERRRWRNDLGLGRLAEWKEMSWRRLDGSQLRVRVSMQVVLDARDQPSFCEGIVEDVSQRVQRDEIVRRGERMASLGRTLAGVAHEINNPLAAIIGFAQILLKSATSASDRRALETVVSEAQRSARIVKDLLTIARRQESNLQERVNLNETAKYILDSQRYAIETRGIRVELIVHPLPVRVRGDPAQLEQVVLNLLVNARQAVETRMNRSRKEPAGAPPGWAPSITLRTQVRDDLARFEIADNGEGIVAADLPHIWDPFWTKHDEGEATGLGLSVVHGIIASHGGAIDARSDERAGTVFSISLPLDSQPVEHEQAREASQLTKPEASTDPRPLDILVVDDEASLRELLLRIFTQRGHAVVTAADGRHAIRLAEQSTFDVVICDLHMPGMDGRDVIAHLSTLENCAKARFILSTGDAATTPGPFLNDDSRIDAVVTKPFKLELLLGVVEQRTDP